MAPIEILEFSDPVCPFAWSAEPSRRRMEWLYGDAIVLRPRMVGLHVSGEEMAAQGFTPEGLASGQAKLAHRFHMPMDTEPRSRLWGSIPACRAVVAVRRHDPARERAILRVLRVRCFSGQLIDELRILRDAAREVGIDPDDLAGWLEEPETERALQEDLAAARRPRPEALALPGKLAETDDGGMRYTCPSWEITHDGRTATVPGMQPLAAYEVALANLAPELTRREDPESVEAVLAWAGEPLATAEVAAVCAIELDEAREALGRVARERHVGWDGLWSPRGPWSTVRQSARSPLPPRQRHPRLHQHMRLQQLSWIQA